MSKITIGGLKWSVVFSTEQEDPELVGHLAYCDSKNLKLVFDKTASPELFPGLLMHELFHAVMFTAGTSLAEKVRRLPEDWAALEEELADLAGSAYFDALNRNGWLRLPKSHEVVKGKVSRSRKDSKKVSVNRRSPSKR